MPHNGGGRRGGEYFCRCPVCDLEESVEEGQECSLLECPRCGTTLRNPTIGRIRQNEENNDDPRRRRRPPEPSPPPPPPNGE